MAYTQEFYDRFPEQQRKTLLKLQDDIVKAQKIRKEEGLPLDIKREEARLNEIQSEQAKTIEDAKVEVAKLVESAKQEAKKILAESRKTSEIETEVAARLMEEARVEKMKMANERMQLDEWEKNLASQGQEQHQKYLVLVKMESELKKFKDESIGFLSSL